jgi:hypothetical protein
MGFCEKRFSLLVDGHIVVNDDFLNASVMSQQERINSARTNIGCVNKRLQPLRSLCECRKGCLVAGVVGVIRSHSIGRRDLFIKVSGALHYFADSFPFVRLHIFEEAQ